MKMRIAIAGILAAVVFSAQAQPEQKFQKLKGHKFKRDSLGWS